MKFLELSVNNFCSIGEAKVNLDERGLILLQGENKDDPSAASNGAGKSSLVDALAWVLYGVTARGIAGDAIVNRSAGRGCAVTVLIEDDKGGRYEVTRYRKHPTGKNKLEVRYTEDPAMTFKDISKGTEKETQALLEQVLGCSLPVFQAAVYAGQEAMPDLPGMSDKQLKLLIEESAGVEILAEAYAEALARLRAAENNVTAKQSAVAALDRDIKLLADEADAAKKAHAEFEATRKDRATDCLRRHKEYADAADDAKRRFFSYDVPKYKARLEEIKKAVESIKVDRKHVDDLTQQAGKAQAALAMAKAKHEGACEKLTARLAAKHTENCPECGRPHDPAQLAALTAAQAEQIRLAREAVTTAEQQMARSNSAALDATQRLDDARKKLADPTALLKEQAELMGLLSQANAVLLEQASKEKDAEAWHAEAKKRLTEVNPHAAATERLVESIRNKTAQHSVAQLEMDEAELKVAIAKQVAEVFSPAGVRAHILDTVTPFLNDRTRDYLTVLSDGTIGAVWTTLSTTAKGELREKFNIEVTNDKGADSFAGLSGGEKRKVRLACALALQDLVASRATKPLRIFIADEIDAALDTAGLERLMTVLNTKSKERGTVLVVSHSDLKDWIDRVITVTKTGGIAAVTGDV